MIKTLAVLAVLVPGCSFIMATTPAGATQRCMPDLTAPTIDAIVAAAALAIDAVVGVRAQQTIPDKEETDAVSLIALPIFVSYGISALYGVAKGTCPSPSVLAAERASAEAEQARVQAERERAWLNRTTNDPTGFRQSGDSRLEILMKTALSRARAGDCATTKVVAAHARELDPELYVRVFAADPTIAACLDRAQTAGVDAR